MISNTSSPLVTSFLLFHLLNHSFLACAAGASPVDSRLPHWIWTTEKLDLQDQANTNDFVTFEKDFDISLPLRSARIRLGADFCQATVFINGVRVISVEPYCQLVDVDITHAMILGKNLIRIQANKVSGPSAIAASLTLGIADLTVLTEFNTDPSWTYSADTSNVNSDGIKSPAVSLGLVTPELWGVDRRSAKVDSSENYEQWQQATPGTRTAENKFWTAPGFEISLIHSATADEGSWVSMAFDPKGRLTIAREDKGLLRLTLDDSKRVVNRVQTINDDLLECRGLLYAHGALYANANNSKGLYRLRHIGDDHDDGILNDVQLLREFPGGVGHGRNDLALGADGWIYSIHGDSVDFPTSNAIDRTSPFRDAREGTPAGQGYVIKTDPDGKQWEVVCSGLRNPFGLAANPSGEWFTYDADAEFELGTPWYRPTRVLHLVSGADFGWRAVTGKWPPYFPDHPDNAMPTLDIGKGSPTAVLFATEADFPDRYRRSLLLLDWTYGRILAVHLSPRGAGFRATAETFLQGRPLNVTDLAIGPDGALYIITGGRKTQSALYRIVFAGEAQTPNPLSLHETHCAEHAANIVAIRQELERLHVDSGSGNLDLAWRQMDSLDPTLRHAARVAIEHHSLDKWRERALSESRVTAGLEASFAMIRSGENAFTEPALSRLTSLNPATLTVGQTWSLVHCYSLLSKSAMIELQARRVDILKQFDSVFPHPLADSVTISACGTSSQLQGAIAMLLVDLGSASIVENSSQTLLLSGAQEDRLNGMLAIRNAKIGWTIETRKLFFRELNRRSELLRGEGMESFLSQIRGDVTASLTELEQKNLADLLVPSADTADELIAITRPLVKKWTVNELVPLLADSAYKPDPIRGAAVFREALCSRCHRSGASGPAVGPDLTHVSNRFSHQDILRSIIEPSHVVAETYRKVQVSTSDGRIIVGRVLVEGDYRAQTLRIATDPLKPSEIQEINKTVIDAIIDSPVSPMPAGLLDSFQANEILDLLEYFSVAQKP